MIETAQETAVPPAAAPSAGKRLCWLALGVLLILSAVLRLHAISTDSIWYDEGISWHQASQAFWTMIRLTAEDVHPPLHNSILYFFIRAFGDSEAALRMPSAILGIATIAAIFWVASLIGGRSVGFLSAALLCFSSYHIHYSQEARPYALLALTATLFAGATLRALKTNRRGWHAASTVAALLLLYSHAYGTLLWFSFAMAVIASAKAWRNPEPQVLLRWAAGQAIAVLLFLPWAGILAWRYKHILTHGFWIPKPDLWFMLGLVDRLASGKVMLLVLCLGTALALAPASLWLRLGLRLGLGADAGIRGAGERHDGRRQAHLTRALLVAWLLGPLLLGLIASLISQPILEGRYVICSLPAWLILASMGFCRLWRMRGKWVFAVALAGALLGATANLWFYQPPQNEDVRAIVRAYVAQAKPGDCVFAFSTDVSYEVGFYLRKPPACYLTTDAVVDIAPWAFSASRGWLFLRDDRPDLRRRLDDSLQAHGWRARTEISDPRLNLFLLEPAK